jgi:hypothetical protein
MIIVIVISRLMKLGEVHALLSATSHGIAAARVKNSDSRYPAVNQYHQKRP